MIKKVEPETYGVYLTPHFEKYQNQDEETSDIMHATWNFGNHLKAQGYSVLYIHGPIALYEGFDIDTFDIPFQTEDHVKEFIEGFPSKKSVFFLFQKLSDKLRVQAIEKELILEKRNSQKKPVRKAKKVLDKAQQLDNNKD